MSYEVYIRPNSRPRRVPGEIFVRIDPKAANLFFSAKATQLLAINTVNVLIDRESQMIAIQPSLSGSFQTRIHTGSSRLGAKDLINECGLAGRNRIPLEWRDGMLHFSYAPIEVVA